jgi:hypothetical protein
MKEKLIKWLNRPENFLVKEFALQNGQTYQDLQDLADKDEDFKKILNLALEMQEMKVIKGALSGDLDKVVALRLLEEFHDWKKKEDNTTKISVLAMLGADRATELKSMLAGRLQARGDQVGGETVLVSDGELVKDGRSGVSDAKRGVSRRRSSVKKSNKKGFRES